METTCEMLAWDRGEREHVDVEWEAKEKSETNSGKKVQFGEKEGRKERVGRLNETGKSEGVVGQL